MYLYIHENKGTRDGLARGGVVGLVLRGMQVHPALRFRA